MTIKILPPDVVSKIAAGEVVERPASAVKELVENSLDAGATQIGVDVRGGGVSLIQVSDNGIGVPRAEIELAFQRHATSKVRSLADVEGTASLGFRGEALPSIAAVAEVEFLSRTVDESAGIYVRLLDGKVMDEGSKGCAVGTTVAVRNLFRNVPARLKFLKSPATESGHIVDLVTRLSLAFPEVRFVLAVDGRGILHTPGNGKVRDTLIEVYGLETAQAMLEVEGGESRNESALLVPAVSGFISPPSISRASRNYYSFFVNRRWVTSRLLSSAVEKAYQGMLMTGRYPIVVLSLSLPPQDVDINVHPTKREIRLCREQAAYSAVSKAVSDTLGRSAVAPEVKSRPLFSLATQPTQPTFDVGTASWPQAASPVSPKLSSNETGILDTRESSLPVLRVLGQLAATYVIAEGPDGLYLIDQHAAHERVVFERILSQRTESAVEMQGVLEPIAIELSAKQKETYDSRGEALAEFGFQIEHFGDKTFLVRAIPASLNSDEVSHVVREVLDSIEDSPIAERERRIAISIACHSAVRAGQVLGQEELRELICQLENTNSPRTCPHGRPIMIHLSSGQLAREFGRA